MAMGADGVEEGNGSKIDCNVIMRNPGIPRRQKNEFVILWHCVYTHIMASTDLRMLPVHTTNNSINSFFIESDMVH